MPLVEDAFFDVEHAEAGLALPEVFELDVLRDIKVLEPFGDLFLLFGVGLVRLRRRTMLILICYRPHYCTPLRKEKLCYILAKANVDVSRAET
jgi:hypothetical protein